MALEERKDLSIHRNALSEAAMLYLHSGLSVIPLKQKGKKPLIDWRQYQETLPTEAEVIEWWKKWPDANIGIVTGDISGLAVVDLDSKAAIAFAKENCFESTPTVKTGKGYHLYYKYKEGVRNFQKRDDLPDIDFRGDGGYVVAPPSIHETGKIYEWVKKKALEDLPLANLPEQILIKKPTEKTPVKELYNGAPEGSRNDALARLTGSWVNDGLTIDDCLDNAHIWNTRNARPLPEKEIERTVRSIIDKHTREKRGSVIEKVDKVDLVDIDPIDKKLISIVPYPFEVFPRAFREDIERESTALQVEPEVVASIKMTILSAAIGNTIRVSPKAGWEISPFLWTGIVAPTGYGKSPTINAFMRPIQNKQGKAYLEYKEQMAEYDEKLLKAKKAKKGEEIEVPKKPQLEHFMVSDTTVEALSSVFEDTPRGVLIYLDELSGMILGLDQYKGKGNDRQHYLELFNSSSWKIDRKSGTRFIPNTGAAIIGGIQPKVMPKVFSADSFDDGLLPRFLMVNVDNKPLLFNRQGLSIEDLHGWRSLLEWCGKIPLTIKEDGFVDPVVLGMDDEAMDLWEVFFNEYGEFMPFLSERVKAFIPKLKTYSLKLAGVLHMINAFYRNDDLGTKIDSETINGAIEITRYYGGQAMKLLSLYEKPGAVRDEMQLRLIRTLSELSGELQNARMPLSKIRDAFNREVPDPLKLAKNNKKLGSMLRLNLGLITEEGTGGVFYLVWEPEKMKKLFLEIKSITSTISTKRTSEDPQRVDLMDIVDIGSAEEAINVQEVY